MTIQEFQTFGIFGKKLNSILNKTRHYFDRNKHIHRHFFIYVPSCWWMRRAEQSKFLLCGWTPEVTLYVLFNCTRTTGNTKLLFSRRSGNPTSLLRRCSQTVDLIRYLSEHCTVIPLTHIYFTTSLFWVQCCTSKQTAKLSFPFCFYPTPLQHINQSDLKKMRTLT